MHQDDKINPYSVLMSVYRSDNADFLGAALKSMSVQTVTPTEIVLVCDGPLTEELENQIDKFAYFDSTGSMHDDKKACRMPAGTDKDRFSFLGCKVTAGEEPGRHGSTSDSVTASDSGQNSDSGEDSDFGRFSDSGEASDFDRSSDFGQPSDSESASESVITVTKGRVRGNGNISFVTVRLPENRGLGPALYEGMNRCSCDFVARMDSDDLSAPDRCRLQLSYFAANPDTAVLSGTVAEFDGTQSGFEEALKASHALKTLPCTTEDILKQLPYRNPFNHPAVMFRKQAVMAAGGYHSCRLFEDYDLWVRMAEMFSRPDSLTYNNLSYKNLSCKNSQCENISHKNLSYKNLSYKNRFANLPEILVCMRTNGMYERRGGVKYAADMLGFRRQIYKKGLISRREYMTNTSVRFLMSLLPPFFRRELYTRFLRRKNSSSEQL